MQSASFTEQLVTEVVSETGLGVSTETEAAFDIMLIAALVTQVFTIIKACQERKAGSAAQALKQRRVASRLALRRAIAAEHSDLPKYDRRELFRNAKKRMESLTDDEVDLIVREAEETIIID